MTKRGKILRDASAGPGLLIADGQEYSFSLEGVWRSETAPRAGLTVEAEIDENSRVSALTIMPDAQLAKEQAGAAGEKLKVLWARLVAAVGLPNLIGIGLLMAAWFFFAAVSIQRPFVGKLELTFWQVLGFLNSNNSLESLDPRGGPGAGIYGLLAFVALLGPFVRYVWKDKRANLVGTLPLLFMLFVWIMARHALASMLGGPGGDPDNPFLREARRAAADAVSMGIGTYLSLLASLYFAGTGVKQFLAGGVPATSQAPARIKRVKD